MTGNRPYHNEATRAERLAAHRNDERVRRGGTYHDFAASEAGVIGGRFAAREKSTVTGSSGSAQYPAQPATSHWHHDPVGPEPALGFSVEDMIPAGGPPEVAASLGEAKSGDVGVLPPDVTDGALPGDARRRGAGSDRPPASPARRRRPGIKRVR